MLCANNRTHHMFFCVNYGFCCSKAVYHRTPTLFYSCFFTYVLINLSSGGFSLKHFTSLKLLKSLCVSLASFLTLLGQVGPGT